MRHTIPYSFKKLEHSDLDRLCSYLEKLGSETRRRFGPHGFDRNSLENLFIQQQDFLGYVATNDENNEIIAYCVLKKGYLEHDSFRFHSYGLTLDHATDCTFAPSVAEEWQGKGVGGELTNFIIGDLKEMGFRRILLWGGVQSDNHQALRYYEKLGFRRLGQFEYFGMNDDMCLDMFHE